MKKSVAWLSIGAVALVAIATFCCLFSQTAIRCDFHYRLAEIDCVRQSVDPFRVWNEEIVVKPYYSNNPEVTTVPEGCSEMISVYVPWEYTLMLPFSFMSKNCSWWMYSALSFAMFLFSLFVVSKERTDMDSRGGDTLPIHDTLILVSVPVLLVTHAMWSNFQVGNHTVVVLSATILMAACLNREKNMMAGLCWVLMMIKPQIGLIFAVPLIMRMRIVTGAVAVGVCLLLSIYPVCQCHASLFDLLTEPSKASAFAFSGCGTWPTMLCGTFGGSGDIVAGTVVGAIVCAAMTWLVRKERDWFVYLMPAAITSCCWTYTQAYSHIMGWFVAFVLVRELLRHPRSRFLWTLAVLSVFSLTRWFLAWHGLCCFAGWSFPMSEYAFRCLDSLNSTLSLAIAAALCVWLHRQSVNFRGQATFPPGTGPVAPDSFPRADAFQLGASH